MREPQLRFLADEGCDFAVVRLLRSLGHDVDAVCEEGSRSVDSELMERAAQAGRILLTEDKDFGWLAFVSRQDSPGIILIRYPGSARESLLLAVTACAKTQPRSLRELCCAAAWTSARESATNSTGAAINTYAVRAEHSKTAPRLPAPRA